MRGKIRSEFTRLDAGLLIHKKRHDKKGFKKMVDDLRKQGFSDREESWLRWRSRASWSTRSGAPSQLGR